jgi:transposase-like protein
MGRVADPRLPAQWRRRIERQRRSGLSIGEFCRREGVSAGSFHQWKRRLEADASKGRLRDHGGAERSASATERSPAGGGFIQVPVAAASAIEVQFADGTRVRLPTDNLAVLSTALKTLQNSQSAGG